MVLAPLPLGTGPALLPVATGIWLQLWGRGGAAGSSQAGAVRELTCPKAALSQVGQADPSSPLRPVQHRPAMFWGPATEEA